MQQTFSVTQQNVHSIGLYLTHDGNSQCHVRTVCYVFFVLYIRGNKTDIRNSPNGRNLQHIFRISFERLSHKNTNQILHNTELSFISINRIGWAKMLRTLYKYSSFAENHIFTFALLISIWFPDFPLPYCFACEHKAHKSSVINIHDFRFQPRLLLNVIMQTCSCLEFRQIFGPRICTRQGE